jgi:hypothetical protein
MPFPSISSRFAGLLAGALLSLNAFAVVASPPTVTILYTPGTIAQGATSNLQVNISDTSGAGFTAGKTTTPVTYFTGTGSPGVVNTGVVPFNSCGGTSFALTTTAGAGSFSITGVDVPASGGCFFYVEVTTTAAGTFTTDYPSGVPFTASTGTNTTPATSTLTVIPPYLVTKPFDRGAGTLRQAILDANSTCSGAAINFNIPGAGPFTISPLTPLPAVTCGYLNIDAFSQPGAARSSSSGGSDNAVIQIFLSGAKCGTCDGISTLAYNITVEGFAIGSFSGAAIAINAPTSVYGNYIGTDPGGMTAAANGIGIRVGASTYATIGSASIGDGNLISGNTASGILVSGGGATVINNLIGGPRNGSTGLGNGGAGVLFQSANYSTNNVGGNYIRYNGAQGVIVDSGTSRALTVGNSIFGNGGIGIDLNNDGPTPNDETPPYDSDSGPNGLQNYPVVTSVVQSGGSTIIGGYIKTTDVSSTYGGLGNIHIELFSNPVMISNTEGQTFLGAVPTGALTDKGGGFVTFSMTHPGLVNNISATALVDTCGDGCVASSEYSPMVAVAAPTVTLTPPTLTFGSTPALATSAPQTVTLLNNGPGPVTPTVTISGDFGFISGCPGSLAALATCAINVTFTPLVPGLRVGTLSVASNAFGSPNTVALSGTGLVVPTPDILVTPGVTEYGAQGIGTDSPVQIITVNSTGTAPLTLGTIDTTLADFVLKPASVAAGRACGTTLAPGDSCDVAVAFHPTAEGIRDGQLRVVNNTASSPATVRIVGRGIVVIPPRQLGMAGQLAFGSQAVGTTSPSQPLAITNNTASPVSITGLDASGDFSVSNSCATIAAHATCTVLVFFQPTAVGARAGAITVHALADSVPYIVTLSGTGTSNPLPALRLSATALGFGNVIYGSSFSQGLTLSNVGTVPLTVINILVSGNSDFTRTTSCTATLAAGATCNVGVTFTPHALGARSGTITVTSNAVGSPHAVSVTGTGCRYFSPAAARFFLTSC